MVVVCRQNKLDEFSGKVTDTSPVLRLRQALQRVRQETQSMEVRCCVVVNFVCFVVWLCGCRCIAVGYSFALLLLYFVWCRPESALQHTLLHAPASGQRRHPPRLERLCRRINNTTYTHTQHGSVLFSRQSSDVNQVVDFARVVFFVLVVV